MLALVLTTALASAPAMPVASFHSVPRLASSETADDPPGARTSQDNADPLMPNTVSFMPDSSHGVPRLASSETADDPPGARSSQDNSDPLMTTNEERATS